MFDCHYDLLTIILMNKYSKEKVRKYFKKIFNSKNIIGGIFNLFYMSYDEMQQELGFIREKINILQNLKDAKKIIEEIMPKEITYIFGIEGLDYLEKVEDVDELYNLGIRSVNIVWNNKNKFGSGIRGDLNSGLTNLGKELIKKLVDKKIAIDLSHTNEKTFWDIVNLCNMLKKQGKLPIVFASHSNAKALCNTPRNLTDEQIIAIKKLDGVIGVVSIKKFCIDTQDICNSNIDFEQKYIEHINYLTKILGSVNNISVSTDDMSYYTIDKEYYTNINVYKQSDVTARLRQGLRDNGYTNKEIDKILFSNFKEKILDKLN